MCQECETYLAGFFSTLVQQKNRPLLQPHLLAIEDLIDAAITRKGVQHPTAIAETTIAETTPIKDKLSGKTTVLEEIELGLFTDFEDTTALEDKKGLTVFPL